MKIGVAQRRDAAEKAPAAQVSGASDPPRPAAGRVNPEERRRRIAVFAYFRAEERGFSPGCELADWLEAEREIDSELQAGTDVRSGLEGRR
jgi:hypothetical protein